MAFGPAEYLLIAAIGLVAGVLGGLLGIGGSVIMIPGLALLLHIADPESQHLYQAAAMGANVAVSLPAALRHKRAGAVRQDVFRPVFISAAIAIILGVLLSNMVPGLWLRRAFALFLLWTGATNLLRLVRGRPDYPEDQARVTTARTATTGGVMGAAAGLLGIGGGVVGIPLMQTLMRLPLRNCIGVSSAVMVLTACVGAFLKVTTLGPHGYSPWTALLLTALLTPTAIIGSRIGAAMTHALPLTWVRIAMTGLLFFAAWRMAAISGPPQSTPAPAEQTGAEGV